MGRRHRSLCALGLEASMNRDRPAIFGVVAMALLAIYFLSYFALVRIGPSMWSVITARSLIDRPADYSLIPAPVRGVAEIAFVPANFLDKKLLRRAAWGTSS